MRRRLFSLAGLSKDRIPMSKIAELFSANVPRYTSYPTAPHFQAGMDAAVYGEWLAALPPQMPLSLYFHIPFCDTLCWFCGCHTSVVNNYAPVRDYVRLLRAEIALVAAALKQRHTVSHIHWGGGSPTMLAPDDIARLDSTIRTHFDLLPQAEYGIEIDPRGLTAATVLALKAAGVTRASIGLQDCDPEVQRAINRIQTDEETRTAMALLRASGISSINLDLVYGLPKQSLKSWERTLEFAVSLKPDRLSVFGYAHVPQFKKHQALIPAQALPSLEERFHQAEFARTFLCAQGFAAIGLDHFARPDDALAKASQQGQLHRNFQGYTTDAAPALVGLGASAIGSLPQGYVQNFPAVPAYRAAIEAGRLPVTRGIAVTESDRMRREVIERLMCDLAVDLDAVAARYGKSRHAFSSALPTLHALARDGMVTLQGGNVTIDPQWRPAVRLACAAFDEYLPQNAARHSVAV